MVSNHLFLLAGHSSEVPNSRDKLFPWLTHRNFYVIDEQLPNESRTLEFKEGQGAYLQKEFPNHVMKYMCAFLNSDGGSLLIGINDDGKHSSVMNSVSGMP